LGCEARRRQAQTEKRYYETAHAMQENSPCT
jgi:hypothetical protein